MINSKLQHAAVAVIRFPGLGALLLSRRRFGIIVLAILGLCASTLRAQDLEPRSYTNLPVGLNFVFIGYGHTTGSVALDASSPLQDGEVTTDGVVLAYARSFNLLGCGGKFDVVVPYAWVEGSATFQGAPVSREVNGFGDPLLRLSWNFLGAPALTMEEFQSYKPDVIVGMSLRVGVPVGHYDEEKLLNISTNRWSFKPAVGFSKTLGPWILELEASVTFFTDNDEFLSNQNREQEPIFAGQAHLIYNIARGLWVGLNGTYYTGGQSTLDGVESDDRLSSSRIGLTLGVPLSPSQSLKFYVNTGLTSRTGDDFTAFGLIWQYRF